MELIKDVVQKDDIVEKIITESSRKCEHCGKPYKDVKMTINMFGKKRNPILITEPDCNCLQLIEERQKQERKEELKAVRLQQLFTNSLMTPYFQTKKFENLKKNDIVIKCQKYADDFFPNIKGLQMIGNIGTGKTTILAAICNKLLEKGYKCLFTTFSDLLGKFTSHSNANAGNITDLLKWLSEFDFVCLDDIGRETYTDKRKEIGFQIIDTLLNYRVTTAFTANPEMIEKLKQIPEMWAALDRLKEMCPIKFEFRGESMRGKP